MFHFDKFLNLEQVLDRDYSSDSNCKRDMHSNWSQYNIL